MPDQIMPHAAIQMRRLVVKQLAEEKIACFLAFLAYREEQAKVSVLEKVKLISHFRTFKYVRYFGRKWTNEEVWDAYTKDFFSYLNNTSDAYKDATRDARFAGEDTIALCRKLATLASVETADNLMWISDEAYRNIAPKK